MCRPDGGRSSLDQFSPTDRRASKAGQRRLLIREAAWSSYPHGDVILVHPGAYSAFSVDKGLTVVGLAPGVNVSWALLGNLPAARKVRLANMTLGVLHALDATGTVLAQDLEVGSVYVMNCGGVR